MLADTKAQPPGLLSMEQSRILAVAFLAGHDALNNIVRAYRPFATAQTDMYLAAPFITYEVAVCNVLRVMLPSHAAKFDQELQTSLAASQVYGHGLEVELGELCARNMLALRADDGSAGAQGPHVPGVHPGAYQPTPPFNSAALVNWGKVRPFAMTSGDQFRAPPPRDVASAAYAADFNAAKSLGAATGSTRTAEQSEMARFWLESTPLSLQRLAASFYASKLTLWKCARLFAMLQMSQADAYVASLDSKYHHNFWRPITAIRAAANDGNPGTAADDTWAPFGAVTPAMPEYPSAHACAATAGTSILRFADRFDGDFGYLSSTGSSERRWEFDSFGQAYGPVRLIEDQIADEICLSRVLLGHNFLHSVEIGRAQGWAVSGWVLSHALPPV
jgi:hypothetical protein